MTDRCLSSRVRRHVLGIGVLILAATAAMPAALGSSHPPTGLQNPTQSPTPTFRASADYVEIDVYATDGKGRFVRNLRKEQFRVLESGQPHAVATLQLVDIPRATAPAPAGASVSDGAASPARLYFLVLDDLHTRPEGSSRVRAIASQFIERCVTSTDRASVVFTSARQNAALELTADAPALRGVVDRFVGHKLPSLTLSAVVSGRSVPMKSGTAEPEELERLDQARAALNTLARVIDYASAFHGQRKTIVLISEGVDVELDSKMAGLRNVRDQIVAVTNAANRANATIYALDPRGVTQGGEHAVEVTGRGASQTSLQNELRTSQAGLQAIAEGTFGTAFVNTGDFDRVYRLIDEASSTYYLLTYSSSTPTDGKFHPVEVTVDVPGVTIRARKGFVKSVLATTPPPPVASTVPAPPIPTSVTPLAATAASAAAAIPPTGGLPKAVPATEATLAVARSADDLVQRASAYVVEYGAALSLVIGIERYRQWVENSESDPSVRIDHLRPWTRETVSEFALVRITDDWLGYRDVYQVDGKAVSDRQDRLRQLFQNTPATAVDQGRKIADESARYNAGGMQRNFNVPTMALFFLHPSNAHRFRFELAGIDTIDGTSVSKVRYRETQKPTIIRTSDGKDTAVTGLFWIDAATGRVLKTSLEISGEARLGGAPAPRARDPNENSIVWHGSVTDTRVATYARVTTSYRRDERIGLLLPAEMVEEYQGVSRDAATREDRVVKINCRATYSDFKQFETSGRVVR